MEFFFRGGGNPTDWNVLGEGWREGSFYTGLDIPTSSAGFPGAELSARGGAARIKASCGIKNLCNQLSNLLPHISRPMSRPPLSPSLPSPIPPRLLLRDSRPTLDTF